MNLAYGAARRLNSIFLNFSSIERIFYEGRETPLSLDDAASVSDSVCLIYIHIPAILDAFADSALQLKAPDVHIQRSMINIVNKKFLKTVDWSDLNSIVNAKDSWIKRIREDIRHRVVHRVPPYVPNAIFSKADGGEHNELDRKIWEAIVEQDFEGVDQSKKRQASLGKPFPVVYFSDIDGYMSIFPNLTEDILQICDLSGALLEIFLPELLKKPHQLP